MNAESISTPPAGHRVGAMPTIYDDELLYSIVARFGRLTGYRDAASANMDLFGRPFSHAATALPSNLNAMAQRLPISLGLTGRGLALRHTLLPYHCAFLPEPAAERAIAKARADGGYNVRSTRTVERPLPQPTKLRFCPDCLLKMERDNEEPHWKRVHQLAIVVVCPEHGCDLRQSEVRPATGDKSLHPAGVDVCGSGLPTVIPSGAAVDRHVLLDLARDARTLLSGGYPDGMTRESGPDYAQLFRDLGYYRGKKLDWGRMLPAAQDAITGIVNALPGVGSIGAEQMGWFAHSLSPNRTGHADRVLIAATIAHGIESLEPRFWAAFDRLTGDALLPLAPAA